MAIMAAMLPLIGTGFTPALIALTLLAIPPILINTQAGLASVDPAILEAARGMGLAETQVVRQVQIPLALPVIIAGFRIAAVEVVASATIGAIIGAGGLGEFIFAGLSLGPAYLHLVLLGAITVALLTLTAGLPESAGRGSRATITGLRPQRTRPDIGDRKDPAFGYDPESCYTLPAHRCTRK
jgi:osmoprotectant transport system permease protein